MRIKIFSVVTLISFFNTVCEAQTIDYSVHANILCHITKYIDWPEQEQTSDFTITIAVESHLYIEHRLRKNHTIITS
jgi:hypothetical protein